MSEMYVLLPTVERVRAFVDTLNTLEGDFELLSGKYVLDARSLMGIFSLDLTQPLRLRIYNNSPENKSALEVFAANENTEASVE